MGDNRVDYRLELETGIVICTICPLYDPRAIGLVTTRGNGQKPGPGISMITDDGTPIVLSANIQESSVSLTYLTFYINCLQSKSDQQLNSF